MENSKDKQELQFRNVPFRKPPDPITRSIRRTEREITVSLTLPVPEDWDLILKTLNTSTTELFQVAVNLAYETYLANQIIEGGASDGN